jgi:hypothetical protein
MSSAPAGQIGADASLRRHAETGRAALRRWLTSLSTSELGREGYYVHDVYGIKRQCFGAEGAVLAGCATVACFSARRSEAPNKPQKGMDSAHDSACTGRRRPLFSADCVILAGSGRGASTAASLGSAVSRKMDSLPRPGPRARSATVLLQCVSNSA